MKLLKRGSMRRRYHCATPELHHVIVGQDGAEVVFPAAKPAAPCLEFTSYLLGLPYKAEEEEIAEDRQFLRNGMRGYIFTADSDQPFELAVGDEVLLGSVLVG